MLSAVAARRSGCCLQSWEWYGQPIRRCGFKAMTEKSSLARQRWQILRASLLKSKMKSSKDSSLSVSVRRISTFNIFQVETATVDDVEDKSEWLHYKYSPLSVIVKVGLLPQSFTLEDIVGYNNTGNVCIWPSEELMAFYCLENISLFKGKAVCELGAGMTGLAGLMLAATEAPNRVILTDGNEKSVDNLSSIIRVNGFSETLLTAHHLHWDASKIDALYSHFIGQFNIIICADCFFFTDVQFDLLYLMHKFLKPDGKAYLFAPERSGTFKQFLEKAKEYFHVDIRHSYHQLITEKHMQYMSSDTSYDPNLHYPYCAVLEHLN